MATGSMIWEQSTGDMGRESCKAPGMAHKARNCTGGGCAETGICQYKEVPLKGLVSDTTTVKKVEDFKGLVDGGGYKASMDDPRKLPMWLVPVAVVRAIAAVLGYGAKKYASNNWRRGMAYSEVYSALQRHLSAWLEGEENDDESKLSHLWHAACCLAFLIEYHSFPKLYGKFDDRFKRPAE